MYAISLYRYGVCGSIAVVGGRIDFRSGDLAIFGTEFFTVVFAFYARTIVISSTIAAVLGGLEEFFAHGGEFPLAFFIVVGLDHGVVNYC